MLSPNHKGFSLIELLVVITIMGVLSAIAFSSYQTAQKTSRDARRRADISEIAKALEINKTVSGYVALATSQFANSRIPYDPLASGTGDYTKTGCGTGTTNRCWYCQRPPSSGEGYCDPAVHNNIDNPNPFQGSWGNSGWFICANLETGSQAYYCKRSQQ